MSYLKRDKIKKCPFCASSQATHDGFKLFEVVNLKTAAEEIAYALFTLQDKKGVITAQRLAFVNPGSKKELGGWSERAAADRIEEQLTNIARTLAQTRVEEPNK